MASGVNLSPAKGLHRRKGGSSLVWAPALLAGAAVLLPVVYLVIRALGAGAEAWELLLRWRTLEIAGRTVLLAATVTVGTALIAVPLAWLTVRSDLPLRRLWAVLTTLPLAIPSYVGAMVVVAALGPRGLVQQIVGQPLGIERLPEVYGFPGAAATLMLLSFPYVLLSVRGALWGLDPALEEAGRTLGYSRWGAFRRVTLPLLRPAIVAGGLLVALYTLSDFGAVSLLRYETLTWAIYLQYEATFDRAVAAALSLILILMAVTVLGLEAWSKGRGHYYGSSARAFLQSGPVPLGPWRWPAVAFCLVVVAFSVALPLAILGYWLVRGLAGSEALVSLLRPAVGSVVVASLAAAAAVVAAFPVARVMTRFPGPLSGILGVVTYSGFALPGIVVALALVFFSVRFAYPVYQSLSLLVFAYVVLFLAPAIGAIKASLLQVSPRVEEAARTVGAGPWRVFARVTLPLAAPGFLSAGALVFLVTVKELPATLLLSPPGFKTLATTVWSASSAGFFAQAAAPALLLVLASGVVMAFLIARGGKVSSQGVTRGDVPIR
ncbi:MAG: iron ABC transporter permease [Chloroflexi bacterium]|nr:iron ABC transporter permease [Chloroflexota bacterium]